MGGFGTSGATVVLLIGIIVSIGVIFPVVESGITDTGAAFGEQRERVLDTKNADFTVSNPTYTEPGNGSSDQQNGELVLHIENTGATELQIDEIDYQLDGAYMVPEDQSIQNADGEERSALMPGETLVAQFTLTEDVNRAYITIETGQSKQQVISNG